MKKMLLALMPALLGLVFITTVSVNAASLLSADFEEALPTGWTTYSSDTNLCSVLKGDMLGSGVAVLKCDSSTQTTGKNLVSRLTSTAVNMTGTNVIYVRSAVDVAVTGAKRVFRLTDDITTFDIAYFDGLVFTAYGTAVPISENTMYDVTLSLDTAANHIVIWLNENKVYDGQLNIPQALNLQSAKVVFNNIFTSKKVLSTWYIDRVNVVPASAYNLTSNPENGKQFIDVTGISTITVDFGIPMSPTTLKGVGIVLESAPMDGQYATIPYNMKSYGDKIELTPVDGFIALNRYKISFNSITDAFGIMMPNSAIEFSTAPTGYAQPTVAITAPISGTRFFPGDNITITAQATSQDYTINKLEFYVDDILLDTDTTAPYSIAWQSVPAGNYTIKARTYDSLGGSADSTAVSINVQPNILPTISFSSLTNGGTLFVSEQGEIGVNTSDSDGTISRVELYLDGEKKSTLTTAPYSFTLANPPMGVHTLEAMVYDNDNGIGVVQINVTIIKVTLNTIKESNFEDYNAVYSNSDLVPVGFVGLGTSNGGYIKPIQTDAQHGYGVQMGGDAPTTGGGPWLALEPNASLRTSKAILTSDLYFSATNCYTPINMKNTATPAVFLSNIEFNTNGKIKIYNGSSSFTEVPYEANKWYSIRYEVNFANSTFDFYLNGVKQTNSNRFRADNFNELLNIRYSFNIPTGTSAAYVVIDNFKYCAVIEYPNITGFSFVTPTATTQDALNAPYDTNTIKVMLSSALNSSTVNSTNVKLTADGLNIPLKSVLWNSSDKSISIVPEFPLDSNMSYVVTLMPSIKTSANIEMGSETKAEFFTQARSFDLNSGKFLVNGQQGSIVSMGDNVAFRAEITNDSGIEKTALVVISSYKNGLLRDVKFKSMFLNNGANTVTTPELYISDSNGVTIEACVLDSWSSRTPLKNRIFVITQ